MNKWLIAASGLTFFTLVAHLFGGGPEIHHPILESNAEAIPKAAVSVIWHWVSGVLLLNGIVYGLAANGHKAAKASLFLVNLQFVVFALLFLFYGITRFGSIFVIGQWLFFVLIVCCGLIGQKRDDIRS
jgi:hypothetical protein